MGPWSLHHCVGGITSGVGSSTGSRFAVGTALTPLPPTATRQYMRENKVGGSATLVLSQAKEAERMRRGGGAGAEGANGANEPARKPPVIEALGNLFCR